MSDQPVTRAVLYNQRYPLLATVLVAERLQWDAILQKNVWAHSQMVCDAFEAAMAGHGSQPQGGEHG